MGTTTSVSESTKIGRELVGKKFRTKANVSLEWCGYDKKYYLSRWEEQSSLTNPHPDTFEIEVKRPLEFMITDIVTKEFLTRSTQFHITFVNDIKITDIGTMREAENNYKWHSRKSVESLNNCKLSVENDVLVTKDLKGQLCWYAFEIKLNGPEFIDERYLEEVVE